jgi:hypothetical protein
MPKARDLLATSKFSRGAPPLVLAIWLRRLSIAELFVNQFLFTP